MYAGILWTLQRLQSATWLGITIQENSPYHFGAQDNPEALRCDVWEIIEKTRELRLIEILLRVPQPLCLHACTLKRLTQRACCTLMRHGCDVPIPKMHGSTRTSLKLQMLKELSHTGVIVQSHALVTLAQDCLMSR